MPPRACSAVCHAFAAVLLVAHLPCAAGQRLVRMSVDGPPAHPFTDGMDPQSTCASIPADCDAVASQGVAVVLIKAASSTDLLVCDECYDLTLDWSYDTANARMTIGTQGVPQRVMDIHTAILSTRMVAYDDVSEPRQVRVEASFTAGSGRQVYFYADVVVYEHHECTDIAHDKKQCRYISDIKTSSGVWRLGAPLLSSPLKSCDSIQFRDDSCTCAMDVQSATVTLSDGAVASDRVACAPQECAVTIEPVALVKGVMVVATIQHDYDNAVDLGTMMTWLNQVTVLFDASTAEARARRRSVSWVIAKGIYVPETGSVYRAFTLRTNDYMDAQRLCAEPSGDVFGMVGYLPTITSRFENVVALTYGFGMTSSTYFFLGAADVGVEGEWRWVTGPEGCPDEYDVTPTSLTVRSACDIFPLDRSFSPCLGQRCSGGTLIGQVKDARYVPVSGAYQWWADPGVQQPDDMRVAQGASCRGSCGEDYLAVKFLPSLMHDWYDIAFNDPAVSEYMCEYHPKVGRMCIDLEFIRGHTCFVPAPETTCETCLDDRTACGPSGLSTCVDPNPTRTSLNDWVCRCIPPTTGPDALGQPATCVLDECTATCATCAPASGCGVMQTCSDSNTSITSTRDWECFCVPPAFGAALDVAMSASCYIDECRQAPCAAGQLCTDPNITTLSLGDNMCVCEPPAAGNVAVGSNATCTLDECSTACDTCMHPLKCTINQSCKDPDTAAASTGDWECRCMAPSSGSAQRANATCEIDECTADCFTCGTCGALQECEDPDKDWRSTRDWTCTCEPPLMGMAVAMYAACTLDECTQDCVSCLVSLLPAGCGESQACADPDTGVLALHDWECRCRPPADPANATMAPAECTLDECAAACPTCVPRSGCGPAQTCRDVSTDAADTGDWECLCNAPLIGSAVARNATCRPVAPTELNECGVACATCLPSNGCGVLQSCTDPNTTTASTGDWVCACDPPATGPQVVAGSAVCTFDECEEAACAAGQRCRDPNTDVASAGDWMCLCEPPAVGTPRVVGSTTCTLDECSAGSAAAAVCEAVQQACVDTDTRATSTDNWECVCIPPAAGAAMRGAPAACVFNDCRDEGDVICSAAGQDCEGGLADVAGDWTCVCRAPSLGRAARAVAVCRTGCAILENNATCVRAEQDCVGGDGGAWACQCRAPATGSAPQAPAVCEDHSGEKPPHPLPGGAELEVSSGSVALAGLLSGDGALGMQLLVVLRDCEAPGQDDRWHVRSLHPTQLTIRGERVVGVIVGNLALCAGAWLAAALVRVAVDAVSGGRVDARGVVRLPSTPLVAFRFLFQGTTLAAMEILIGAGGATGPAIAAGVAGLAVCAVVPLVTIRAVIHGATRRGYFRFDAHRRSGCTALLLGPGEWVSRRSTHHWVNRWSCVLRPYAPRCLWFVGLEFLSAFALSALHAAVVLSDGTAMACGHVKLASAVVLFGMAAVVVAVRPHCYPRNNVLATATHVLQGLGMCFMGVGYYSGVEGAGAATHWAFIAAGIALAAAVGLVIVRILLDVLGVGYAVVSGRRQRVQDKAYHNDGFMDDDDHATSSASGHDGGGTPHRRKGRINTIKLSLYQNAPLSASLDADAEEAGSQGSGGLYGSGSGSHVDGSRELTPSPIGTAGKRRGLPRAPSQAQPQPQPQPTPVTGPSSFVDDPLFSFSGIPKATSVMCSDAITLRGGDVLVSPKPRPAPASGSALGAEGTSLGLVEASPSVAPSSPGLPLPVSAGPSLMQLPLPSTAASSGAKEGDGVGGWQRPSTPMSSRRLRTTPRVASTLLGSPRGGGSGLARLLESSVSAPQRSRSTISSPRRLRSPLHAPPVDVDPQQSPLLRPSRSTGPTAHPLTRPTLPTAPSASRSLFVPHIPDGAGAPL